MNTTLKLVLAPLFPLALTLGCIAPVEPESEQDAEEPVAAVEQPLPASEVWTIYYSDETFSHVVGRDTFRCNGSHTRSGTTSDYFWQSSEACNEGNPFSYQDCYICDDYTGTQQCVVMQCPPSIAF